MSRAPLRPVEELDNPSQRRPPFAQMRYHGQNVGSFLDDYICGNIEIALRCRGLFDVAQNGLTISARLRGDDTHFCGDSEIAEREAVWSDLHAEQSSMFSGHVQVMEGPQKIISSEIRLERYDDRSFRVDKPFFAFDTVLRVNKVEPGTTKGKVRIHAWSHAVACGDGTHQEIERAPESVDVTASGDIEFSREGGLLLNYCRFLSTVRINLFHKGYEIGGDPSVQLALESWDLGYGPIDGLLSVQEIIAHGTK